MSFSSTPGTFGAADPLFLLLAALALEAYLGGPWIAGRRYLQPRLPVTGLVIELDRRLNRPDRGGLDLFLRGAVVALGLALAAYVAGWLVEGFLVRYPFAWVFEVLLLALIIGQRTPCMQAGAVSKALAEGSLIAAQEALRPLTTGRVAAERLAQLDARGIVAVALDGLARAFSLQVIAPVFWFALLGLPGVFLQLTVRTAAAFLAVRQLQLGPKAQTAGQELQVAGRSEFAQTALRLDRALAFIPMILAGVVLIAAAIFIPGCHPGAALRQALTSRGNVAATMGGLLGLTLPGDQGLPVQLERGHIERAVAVFAVGCLINGGLVAVLVWIRAVI